MAKLIFIGDIRKIFISKSNFFCDEEKGFSHNLIWKRENSQNIDLEILFCDVYNQSGLILNPTQDFIDLANKKINKLKESYRVYHDDYYKPISHLNKIGNGIENLILLIKYNECQLIISKNQYIVNTLTFLYKKILDYVKMKNDLNLINIYQIKLDGLLTNQDMDCKLLDNSETKLNFMVNFFISRSYNSIYKEEVGK